jgi:primase-polymerase (primpol)-like protein
VSNLTIEQFSGLPYIPALDELKEIPQWVAWRYEQRNGKPTKPPIDPHTGRYANCSNSRTWGTYEDAEKRARVDCLPGIGFVLSASDELTGYDLDKCRDPKTGKLKPWV